LNFYTIRCHFNKREIRERAKMNSSWVFSDYPIAPPNRDSKKDIGAFNLQKDAIVLANEATTALQGIAAATPQGVETAKQMLTDIVSMASEIATRGSLDRVQIRDPKVASVLRWSGVPVITQTMKDDFEQLKEIHSSNFRNTTSTGFGRYRVSSRRNRLPLGNNLFSKSYNTNQGIIKSPSFKKPAYVANEFAKGFQAGLVSQSKPQFFPRGGEDHRRILSKPQDLTSRIPGGVQVVPREAEEPEEEEVING
jgi:hypothetical protein